jgi:hypothetical protein
MANDVGPPEHMYTIGFHVTNQLAMSEWEGKGH